MAWVGYLGGVEFLRLTTMSDLNCVDEKKRESYEEDVRIEDDGYILQCEVRQAAERSLVRKLDFRLLPTIVIIFIMNYIDVSKSSSLLWRTLTEASIACRGDIC